MASDLGGEGGRGLAIAVRAREEGCLSETLTLARRHASRLPPVPHLVGPGWDSLGIRDRANGPLRIGPWASPAPVPRFRPRQAGARAPEPLGRVRQARPLMGPWRTGCARRRTIANYLPDEEAFRREVREWVARTCAEQGLPEKITDPATLRKIAAILLEGRGHGTGATIPACRRGGHDGATLKSAIRVIR